MRAGAVAFAVAAALCQALPVYSAETPRPGQLDYRVRTVDFVDGQVYRITGFFHFHALVEFGADERVEKVGGFDKGWNIDDLGRRLLISPELAEADSNLTVVTNRRVYFFDLSVRPASKKYRNQAEDPDQTYGIRFRYPQDEALRALAVARELAERQPSVAPAARPRNADYSVMGSPVLAPYEAWDDGLFTYLRFAAQADLPAVFVINADGTEGVVNKSVDPDGTVIVHRVAKQFVLRLGGVVACLYNEAPASPPQSDDARKTASPLIERVVKGGSD